MYMRTLLSEAGPDFQPSPAPPAYAATRRLFLRLVGAVYLIAFWSIGWQIEGLFGARGIAPAERFLEQVGPRLGPSPFLEVPTVLWWLGASDATLHAVCTAGMILAAAVIAGLLPLPALALLWLLYLSLVSVGSPFLQFQWDALLLETGFLAILWAPATWRLASANARRPSPIVLFLLRFLLFRLMFFSGWVKLASDDPVWWDLTALEYHYWTQPLPTWTSWYANLLPTAAQQVSCAIMFAIELGLPFLIFAPRRARIVAATGFLLLQGLIAATGNYGFFNLLAAALCVPLLDDDLLARRGRRREARSRPPAIVELAADAVVAMVLLALALPLSWRQLAGTPSPLDGALAPYTAWLDPLQIVNPYGLFAVMTRTRPEIEIEGSADGETWRRYDFRWKPGPLERAPRFVEPDMPRLDWQMWFDGLAVERMLGGGGRGYRLVTPRLLESIRAGSPPVLALLDGNPFPDGPPRFLRWSLHHYRFTDAVERRATGHWWKRELVHAENVSG
jgi:hypothetical protein